MLLMCPRVSEATMCTTAALRKDRCKPAVGIILPGRREKYTEGHVHRQIKPFSDKGWTDPIGTVFLTVDPDEEIDYSWKHIGGMARRMCLLKSPPAQANLPSSQPQGSLPEAVSSRRMPIPFLRQKGKNKEMLRRDGAKARPVRRRVKRKARHHHGELVATHFCG